jgi:hypothetical protein
MQNLYTVSTTLIGWWINVYVMAQSLCNGRQELHLMHVACDRHSSANITQPLTDVDLMGRALEVFQALT